MRWHEVAAAGGHVGREVRTASAANVSDGEHSRISSDCDYPVALETQGQNINVLNV